MIIQTIFSLLLVVTSHAASEVRLDDRNSCATYLLDPKGISQLPNPAAVVIDLGHRRILFSLSPKNSDGRLKVETSRADVVDSLQPKDRTHWRDYLANLNAQNFALAPLENHWVDMTKEILFAEQIFAEYDAYDADYAYVKQLNCFAIGTKFFGLGQSTRFSVDVYLHNGFHELDATPIEQASLCAIYRMTHLGRITSTHVYLPIRGTQWAIHKAGSRPLSIESIADIRTQYIDENVSPAIGFAPKYFQRMFADPSHKSNLSTIVGDPEWRRHIKRAQTDQDTLLNSLTGELRATTRPSDFQRTILRRLKLKNATIEFPTSEGIAKRRFALNLNEESAPLLVIQLNTVAEAREFTRLIYAAFIVHAHAQQMTSLNAETGLINLSSLDGPWIDAFGLSKAQVEWVDGRPYLIITAADRQARPKGYSNLLSYFGLLLGSMQRYLSLDL